MARFIGGPCDGRFAADPLGQQRVCGGATYTLGADGNYHPAAAGGGGGASGPVATHGHQGYADLQRSVNRTVPTALAHARTVRRAARRKLARRGRLG